jgi:hypothetical protein
MRILQGIPFFVSCVSIGENNTSAPINWRGRIFLLNRHGGTNFQDKYLNILGFTLHHLIKKSIRCANTIGAVITERNTLTPLFLFIMTSPINKALASGNGKDFLHGNNTFRLQKILDRHNARPRQNY